MSLLDRVIKALNTGNHLPVSSANQSYLMQTTGKIVGAPDVWHVGGYFLETHLYRNETRVKLTWEETMRLRAAFRPAIKAARDQFNRELKA